MTGTAIGMTIRRINRLFDEGLDGSMADSELLGRYLSRRDGPAFEALVARHGMMVLATCRAVVKDPNDADDAFQATFLALVRKAGTIRRVEALGGWLHHVAHRAAVQANLDAARRRDVERKAGIDRPSTVEPAADDSRSILNEELARLPDRFRQPIVLCHLEGKTHAQAAFELGWGEATVRRRLADARERLRTRLDRRGVAPSALLGLAPAAARVSPGLVAATVRMVGSPSGPALGLAKAVVSALAWSKLRSIATVGVVLAGLAGVGVGVAAAVGRGEPAARPMLEPLPQPAQAKSSEADRYKGIVLGPDGQPIKGAYLRLWVDPSIGQPRPSEVPIRASTGVDGRFDFRIPDSDGASVASRPNAVRNVVATAKGLAMGWSSIMPGGVPGEMTIPMAADDPVEGRIVDLEGRPVVGAEVGIEWLAIPVHGVDSLLAAVKNDPAFGKWLPGDNASMMGPLPGHPATVKAGADGRFRVDGLGRDRIAAMVVKGPGIAQSKLTVLVRPMATLVPTGVGDGPMRADDEPPFMLRGSKFDIAAIPSRTITGVVRDRTTGKPVAGVHVTSPKLPQSPLQRFPDGTKTDDQGRYTLVGHPKAASYEVLAFPEDGSPYIARGVVAADTAGLAPIEVEIALNPGIPFRVRPVDGMTGEPVECEVTYHALHPNPNVAEQAGPAADQGPLSRAIKQPDGSYTGVMLPGPGIIGVEGAWEKYLPTRFDPWIHFRPGEGPKPEDAELYGDDKMFIVETGEGRWYLPSEGFQAIVPVDPKPGSDPVDAVAELKPARSMTLGAIGPDDRPLTGVEVWKANGYDSWSSPMPEASFELTRVDPLRPRKIVLRHVGLKLAAQLMIPEVAKVRTIKLQPWGTFRGRLVDAKGNPRPGLKLFPNGTYDDPNSGAFTDWTQTDADGRFRVEGLVPGLRYSLTVMVNGGFQEGSTLFKDVIVEPGEDRDLGDVRAESDRAMK